METRTDVPLIPLFVSMALLTQQFDPETPFALQCIRASGFFRYSEDIELFLLKAYIDRKRTNFTLYNNVVILLMDGLDECISRELKVQVEQVIASELATNNMGIVITSRIYTPLSLEFLSSRILPLVRFFSRFNLLQSIEMQIDIAIRRGVKDTEFLNMLSRAEYSTLAQTPLLLSMMISIFLKHNSSKSESFPDLNGLMTRANIYAHALDDMLKIHFRKLRNSQKIMGDSNFDQERDKLFSFLMYLARFVHEHRQVYFTDDDVQRWFSTTAEDLFYWKTVREWVIGGQYLSSVLIGVHTYDKTHRITRYRFSHLSFQEYLTSHYWTTLLREEQSKNLAASKKATAFGLFGGYGLPMGKFGFSINMPKKFVKMLLTILYDSWYRDTLCIFGSIVTKEEYYNLILTLLKMISSSYSHDSVLFDSIVHNMCRERKSHIIEPELFQWIQEQLSTKTRMDLLLGGSVHVNGNIRHLSKRLILIYENMLDFDMVVDFLINAATGTAPVVIDSPCVELLLKKMNSTCRERYVNKMVELFWESQNYPTEVSNRHSATALKRRIRIYNITLMRGLRFIEFSNDQSRQKVLARAKQVLQDTTLHSNDASIDLLCAEASLLLINHYTPKDSSITTSNEIAIQVLKTMFFSSQVNRVEGIVKRTLGNNMRQYILRQLKDRNFLSLEISPDLLATVTYNLEQSYNLTGFLMPWLSAACGHTDTIVKIFTNRKITDAHSIERDFWLKILDAMYILVCEDHESVAFLKPTDVPNPTRDDALFKLLILFECGEWLLREKVMTLLNCISRSGGQETTVMNYLIRKITALEHIYSDEEERNHQVILNTASNCIELWSTFCSRDFDFQNMPLPGIIVDGPPPHSRTLNSLPFLYHCLKNTKFDVRREAVKAIVRCLYSGEFEYDETRKRLISPWIKLFNKRFVELMITDQNVQVVVAAINALPQLLAFGDHYGENNINCYKMLYYLLAQLGKPSDGETNEIVIACANVLPTFFDKLSSVKRHSVSDPATLLGKAIEALVDMMVSNLIHIDVRIAASDAIVKLCSQLSKYKVLQPSSPGTRSSLTSTPVVSVHSLIHLFITRLQPDTRNMFYAPLILNPHNSALPDSHMLHLVHGVPYSENCLYFNTIIKLMKLPDVGNRLQDDQIEKLQYLKKNSRSCLEAEFIMLEMLWTT
jgi:hypothetical protein